uniref:Transthyretin-like family protein n=1 Tax=Steinernema glaseri TaxID=37863 RepID=A0A1I8AHT5_9BILA
MQPLLVCLILSICFCSVSESVMGIGRTQSAGVRGTLTCNGRPAANVKVKLYDDDRGIGLDDLMAAGRTDAQGRFELVGHETEITDIDPKLNVYHDCEDGIKVVINVEVS